MKNENKIKFAQKMAKGPLQKTSYSFIKILSGSDLSRRRLPFMAVESQNPGPSVWLTACGHGDEIGGIVVIQEIFKKIQRIKLTKGSVFSFPLMNPMGFETSSRSIILTTEDLNRSFPGNKNGSLGERIADRIFTSIIRTKPALVLDLHNDYIKSIPYTLIDPDPGAEYKDAYEKTLAFGKITGFLNVREMDDLKRSLSYNLIKNKIPALTLELGEPYIVNEKNIEFGVKSVWNILTSLKMVDSTEEYFQYPLFEEYNNMILQYSENPLSSTSGVIRFLVKPGVLVKKGQPVARIYNAFGKAQETINCLNDAIVLGHSDYSVSFPGLPILAFGVF